MTAATSCACSGSTCESNRLRPPRAPPIRRRGPFVRRGGAIPPCEGDDLDDVVEWLEGSAVRGHDGCAVPMSLGGYERTPAADVRSDGCRRPRDRRLRLRSEERR